MEAKRRLPSWMAGASKADKVSKPLDSDETDVIKKEEVSVVTKSRKPKAKVHTQKHKKEVGLPSDGKSILVKCETKRKKRGFVEKDVIEGLNPEQEVIVEKRKRGRVKRKDEEHDPSRNKEEKSYEFENNNENQAPSDDEEDEDLTVDDLLSIAKEFVANYTSDIDQQKPSEGHYKSKSKSSYNSSSVTTTSLVVPQDTNSSLQEETASHHDSIKNTSKVTLADSQMTGDPAQDMLDLFLGPLLRKPIKKEETISIKDIIHPHEVKNQQCDAVISDKPVIFTKKKSSLRDAVAMLLD